MDKPKPSIKETRDRILLALSKLKSSPEFWDSEAITPLKTEIKEYLKRKSMHCCSYCRRDISGEHNMILDIEHIVPKDEHPTLTFEIDNIAISCRRCNFKKNSLKDAFTTSDPQSEFKNSFTYKFIHPNIDDYYQHLNYICLIINGKRLIKYFLNNKSNLHARRKASYTYDFFEFRELERYNILKEMKIQKPNTILALKDVDLQEKVAQAFVESHALKKEKQEKDKDQKKKERDLNKANKSSLRDTGK